MFLSRAVSPAILTKHTNEQTHTVSVAALHPTEPKKNPLKHQSRGGKGEYQGCCRACSQVYRLLASKSIRCMMKSLATNTEKIIDYRLI